MRASGSEPGGERPTIVKGPGRIGDAMTRERTATGRASWSVLAGLSFGAVALALLGWRGAVGRVLEPLETAVLLGTLWTALVASGGACWWLVAERGPGPTRERAALAGVATTVATPWVWGALQVAVRIVGAIPDRAMTPLAGGPFTHVSQIGLLVWAHLGVPAAVAGAVVGVGVGHARRVRGSVDDPRPAAVTRAVARRAPALPAGRRPWTAIGAVAFGVAGAIGTHVAVGVLLQGGELALALAIGGVAAATTGGLATWALTASGWDLLWVAAAGATAGVVAIPLAAGPLVVGTAALPSGGEYLPGALARVEWLAVVQFAAVGGGTLAVSLVAWARTAAEVAPVDGASAATRSGARATGESDP